MPSFHHLWPNGVTVPPQASLCKKGNSKSIISTEERVGNYVYNEVHTEAAGLRWTSGNLSHKLRSWARKPAVGGCASSSGSFFAAQFGALWPLLISTVTWRRGLTHSACSLHKQILRKSGHHICWNNRKHTFSWGRSINAYVRARGRAHTHTHTLLPHLKQSCPHLNSPPALNFAFLIYATS